VSAALLVVMGLAAAVLVWSLVTRGRTCKAHLVKCRCVQRGAHLQHRCVECHLSWRDGQHGITFGGES
jgi:hypothetical protein